MSEQLKSYKGDQNTFDYVLHLYRSGNDIKAIADHMDW
jgi:hypothetical protein